METARAAATIEPWPPSRTQCTGASSHAPTRPSRPSPRSWPSGGPLRRGAQLMTEYGTAHLVVVDPTTSPPLGVLSTLDVARTLASES